MKALSGVGILIVLATFLFEDSENRAHTARNSADADGNSAND
jgi:hypothetical protein